MQYIQLDGHPPFILCHQGKTQQVGAGQYVLGHRVSLHLVLRPAEQLERMNLKKAGAIVMGEVGEPHQVLPAGSRQGMDEAKFYSG